MLEVHFTTLRACVLSYSRVFVDVVSAAQSGRKVGSHHTASAISYRARAPCMWRSNRAVVSRSDPRGTTSSICP